MRTLKTSSVARALQSIDHRMRFDFPQVCQTQAERLLYFTANTQAPFAGIQRARLEHVIADKEVRHRRDPGVHELGRHFQIKKTEGAQDHSLFTRNRWRGALVCSPA